MVNDSNTTINQSKYTMRTAEFNLLFKTYEGYFRKVARFMTRNQYDSEDLFQESLLKMYSRFDQFKQGTNFKNWGHTVIKNTFINWLRKNKLKRTTNIDEGIPNINLALSESNAGELNLLKEEIDSAIDNIGEAYKESILLLIKGYSYEEISKKTHTPIGTVKSRIHLGRKQLKSLLKSHI